MTPRFFEFLYNMPNGDNSGTLWAMRLDVPAEPDPVRKPCSICGARPMRYHGMGRAQRVQGKYWADIFGAATGPGRLYSERVVKGLRSIGATGFVEEPAIIESVTSRELFDDSGPDYYYLTITGEISIDWKRSGLNEPCPVCGAPRSAQIKCPEKLYPLYESWDGSDLFYGRPFGGPFCTYRVLMLARERRWTNFKFYPIDRTDYERSNWEGIDYLGSYWPPVWYADRPSAGKTREEWLEEYFSNKGETQSDFLYYQIAQRALDDLGDEVLAPLTERFNNGSLRAAQAIRSIAQRGTPVPPDLLDRAEQAVWADEVKYNPHLFERNQDGRLKYKNVT